MRRCIFFFISLAACLCLKAQGIRPDAIKVGYFGEMISHPGIRVKIDYTIKHWEKVKKKACIKKQVSFGPGLGYFYHRRYQSGLLTNIELKLSRSKKNYFSFSYGIGAGYLATRALNVYEVNALGEVSKKLTLNHYFASNIFCEFTGDFSKKNKGPFGYTVSPNFVYALPNFPRAVGYLFLELGLNYSL